MIDRIPVEVAGIMFVATIFRTVFGFGEALVAVPLLALVISIKVAVPVAVLASIVIAGFFVFKDAKHIHLQDAAWLIVSTLFGLPLGLWLLKTVSESATKGVLALIIFAFSGYSLLGPRKMHLKDNRFAWIFGLLAGIAGGSYGMNGPPLAIYGSLRKWSPAKFRATLQGYFLPASILGICGFAAVGLWTPTVNRYFAWSLPAVIGGIILGRWLNRRMPAPQFDWILHFGLILVGLMLLAQSLGLLL